MTSKGQVTIPLEVRRRLGIEAGSNVANVLLDLFTDDVRWVEWSSEQLAAAFDRGPVVNPLVYAELSVGFAHVEDLEEALPRQLVREGLPDFFIAAHAAVTGRALLTRDRPRYRDLLPALTVVAPG